MLLLFFLNPAVIVADSSSALEQSPPKEALYTYTTPSHDGIGKLYMGREIAQVMGHRGAQWLERSTRAYEEMPDLVIESMRLAPDAVVADVGAGTGYFTVRIANVIPRGQIYAVDIQAEMLAMLRKRRARLALANITLVQAEPDNPRLPAESIDAVLLVDVYHEFSHPYEMMRALLTAMRAGGRLYLVEYRGEDPSVAIKPLHKMTQIQAKKELQAVGLQWRNTLDFLPTQHLMIFEKPVEQ